MLRNRPDVASWSRPASVLNEVLSLNAQELLYFGYATIAFPLLNEVLSLNAQE